MSAVFLETSALLRMLFQEDGGDIIVKRLRASERVICSRLIRVETERALIRLSLNYSKSQKLISKLQHELRLFWPKVDFIEITREI
jgi:uncharacterized protein with PIN domain